DLAVAVVLALDAGRHPLRLRRALLRRLLAADLAHVADRQAEPARRRALERTGLVGERGLADRAPRARRAREARLVEHAPRAVAIGGADVEAHHRERALVAVGVGVRGVEPLDLREAAERALDAVVEAVVVGELHDVVEAAALGAGE